MRRLVVITVGKTTFARKVEEKLGNSVVIDQDNHAEFIRDFYQ